MFTIENSSAASAILTVRGRVVLKCLLAPKLSSEDPCPSLLSSTSIHRFRFVTIGFSTLTACEDVGPNGFRDLFKIIFFLMLLPVVPTLALHTPRSTVLVKGCALGMMLLFGRYLIHKGFSSKSSSAPVDKLTLLLKAELSSSAIPLGISDVEGCAGTKYCIHRGASSTSSKPSHRPRVIIGGEFIKGEQISISFYAFIENGRQTGCSEPNEPRSTSSTDRKICGSQRILRSGSIN